MNKQTTQTYGTTNNAGFPPAPSKARQQASYEGQITDGMIITSQSKAYAPERVTARYVRRSPVDETYSFCEVGPDRRYDIRQGRVDGCLLPADIRAMADEQRQQAFGYVLWPMMLESVGA